MSLQSESQEAVSARVAQPEPQAPSATAIPTKPSAPTSRRRNRAFLIFFIILLAIGIGGLLYWLHARQFETTDDAQVDAHFNPISARIDGNITKVYVDDNQFVQTGAQLVDLDEQDYRIALDQALAQLSQARSMVIGSQPNIPITQTENTTNISTGQADVANAEAALAAAERDRESSAAKLAEAEANNGRAQADLARYKLLIAKEEVSQQEYDQISATAKAQAATVTANQAGLASAARIVDQRVAQLQQSQSKLTQYRQNAPGEIAIRRATVIQPGERAKCGGPSRTGPAQSHVLQDHGAGCRRCDEALGGGGSSRHGGTTAISDRTDWRCVGDG